MIPYLSKYCHLPAAAKYTSSKDRPQSCCGHLQCRRVCEPLCSILSPRTPHDGHGFLGIASLALSSAATRISSFLYRLKKPVNQLHALLSIRSAPHSIAISHSPHVDGVLSLSKDAASIGESGRHSTFPPPGYLFGHAGHVMVDRYEMPLGIINLRSVTCTPNDNDVQPIPEALRGYGMERSLPINPQLIGCTDV